MAEVVQRPRIEAMERGPGPGKYGPNMAPTWKKAPQFSLAKRPTKDIVKIDDSPGPKYGIEDNLTYKGAVRNPSFSLASRNKDPIPFNTPGPGSYQVETCPVPGERKSSCFSMGRRTRYRKRDNTPAPSEYSLPTTLGHKVVQSNTKSSRAFGFNSKTKKGGFDEDLKQTPGPCAYAIHDDNKTMNKAPCASMSARTYIPGDPTQKPGPGAHSPEKCTIHKPRAQAANIGMKQSEYVTPLIVDVDY